MTQAAARLRRSGAAWFASLLLSPAPAVSGDILHYVRANSDGSEAEHVYVFRPAPSRLEVYKMRERCTNAALVTAEVDPKTGEVSALTGGRLKPDGTQHAFAFLWFDPATATITIRADLPDGAVSLSTKVGHRPWHLYDFDLASLSVATEAMPDRRSGFSFGLPLLLVGPAGPRLSDLGRADARFVATETRSGRSVHRFEVTMPRSAGKGGPLWIDAATGRIVAARWNIPNHDGYRDFSLELQAVRPGGRDAWNILLRAHHAGCGA